MFENFSKTDTAKKTFIIDNYRCFFAGLIEAGFNAFALLIAIRVFHASKLTKSLLTSAWFAGYFLTPITQTFATRTVRFKTMDISTMYLVAVSLIVFVTIFVTSFHAFLALIMIAMVLFKQPIPLMSDVYGQNYSSKERGSRLAFVLMVLPLSTTIFSPIGGKLMDFNLQNYRIILSIVSLAAIGAAISFYNIPSRVLPQQEEKSVFSNFKIIFKDKLFGMMLLWWTFAGVANQMTKPLRTEYLVNPDYGINASNFFETLVCITIPFGFRILSSLSWGKLFDKSKIINVKILVNCFLILGFFIFFHARSAGMISFASALMGIAYGGGEVIWCLWVTRIAPKEKFSAYMSANIAIVGLRGFFSPFIGYSLLHYLTLQQISWIAAILVLISTLGFISLRKHPRFSMENN